jgi:hypothetical protein
MTVPPALKDLLVREAHLRLSREAIQPAIARLEAGYQALEAGKPGVLAAKSRHEAHAEKLSQLAEQRERLRGGLEQLDRVEAHLGRLVLNEAEDYCRSTFPEYRQALAIRQHRADWMQWLERFTEKAANLTRALGTLRNMVCTGYSREQHTYSPFALQALPPATEGAKEVEAEIKFANEISRLQEEVMQATGVDAAALPRLPEADFSQRVDKIMQLPLVEAQVEFERIIAEVKQLHETGIPQLRAQAEQAGSSQEEILLGYVALKLDEVRQLVAPEVNPQETERNVAESERLYAGA